MELLTCPVDYFMWWFLQKKKKMLWNVLTVCLRCLEVHWWSGKKSNIFKTRCFSEWTFPFTFLKSSSSVSVEEDKFSVLRILADNLNIKPLHIHLRDTFQYLQWQAQPKCKVECFYMFKKQTITTTHLHNICWAGSSSCMLNHGVPFVLSFKQYHCDIAVALAIYIIWIACPWAQNAIVSTDYYILLATMICTGALRVHLTWCHYIWQIHLELRPENSHHQETDSNIWGRMNLLNSFELTQDVKEATDRHGNTLDLVILTEFNINNVPVLGLPLSGFHTVCSLMLI